MIEEPCKIAVSEIGSLSDGLSPCENYSVGQEGSGIIVEEYLFPCATCYTFSTESCGF